MACSLVPPLGTTHTESEADHKTTLVGLARDVPVPALQHAELVQLAVRKLPVALDAAGAKWGCI